MKQEYEAGCIFQVQVPKVAILPNLLDKNIALDLIDIGVERVQFLLSLYD